MQFLFFLQQQQQTTINFPYFMAKKLHWTDAVVYKYLQAIEEISFVLVFKEFFFCLLFCFIKINKNFFYSLAVVFLLLGFLFFWFPLEFSYFTIKKNYWST